MPVLTARKSAGIWPQPEELIALFNKIHIQSASSKKNQGRYEINPFLRKQRETIIINYGSFPFLI